MALAIEKENLAVRLDPVFVLGYSRSGTTMLRLMLNRHPDLFVPKESEYFQRVPRLYRDRVHQVQDIDWLLKTLPKYYKATLDEDCFRELLAHNLPGDNKILLACLYQACAKSVGKPTARWGEKKPQNWQFVYKLREWYPQAQFVHIIRDPRDVITSMERSLPKNVKLRRVFPAHIILAWQWQYLIKTLAQQAEILGQERYCQLKYEELTSNSLENLTKLCDFLGLSTAYVEEMLNFHEDAKKPGIGDAGSHMEGTRKQLNSRSIGSFQSYLTEKQIREIEFVCGETMKELGYGLVQDTPPWSDRLRISLTCNLLTTIWKGVRITRRLVGSL